jgi:hypothetical protein
MLKYLRIQKLVVHLSNKTKIHNLKHTRQDVHNALKIWNRRSN